MDLDWQLSQRLLWHGWKKKNIVLNFGSSSSNILIYAILSTLFGSWPIFQLNKLADGWWGLLFELAIISECKCILQIMWRSMQNKPKTDHCKIRINPNMLKGNASSSSYVSYFVVKVSASLSSFWTCQQEYTCPGDKLLLWLNFHRFCAFLLFLVKLQRHFLQR